MTDFFEIDEAKKTHKALNLEDFSIEDLQQYIQELSDENGILKLKNNPCQYILKKGKNKGNQCGKNCYLGYDYCKVHKKAMKVE